MCFKRGWNLSQFRQWLGFVDSPVVDPTALSTFYNSLSPDPNNTSGQLDTWIDVMEFPESGVRTEPVVYSKETDGENQVHHGETVHHEMNMRSGRHMDDNPPNKQKILMTPSRPLDQLGNPCHEGPGVRRLLSCPSKVEASMLGLLDAARVFGV